MNYDLIISIGLGILFYKMIRFVLIVLFKSFFKGSKTIENAKDEIIKEKLTFKQRIKQLEDEQNK